MAATDRSSLQKMAEATRLVRRADLRGVPGQSTAKPLGPVLQFVKCTGTTVDSTGYFPAVLQIEDPTDASWSDGDPCKLDFPNNETPVSGTLYGCRFQGYDDSGNPVYTAVGGEGGNTIVWIKCTGTTATASFYPGTLSTPTTSGWTDGTSAVSFLPLKPDGSPTVTPVVGMRYPAVLLTGTQYVLIAPIVKCVGNKLQVG